MKYYYHLNIMNDNTTVHIKPFKDTKVTCMK